MKLYLCQHAKATPKEVDPEQALSDQGRHDIERLNVFLDPLKIDVGPVWHSPKKRAVQTAQMISEILRVEDAVTVQEGLGPSDDVGAMAEKLVKEKRNIMIVGHQPFVGKLASLLLSGSESAVRLGFTQGSMACLSREDQGEWQLDWMVIPRLLVFMP